MRRYPWIVIVRVKQLVARARSRARRSARPDSQWAAMPGNRLELGATGYDIRLVQLQPTQIGAGLRFIYMAYDPEGNAMASTPGDLEGLKRLVEDQARNRQEFKL
jgi:hypothetical protein